MLTRLASFSVTRRRLVLVLALVFMGLAGALGGGVAKELSGGGFDDPKAPSEQAAALLHEQFGGGTPTIALLLTSKGNVDDAAVAAAGQRVAQQFAQETGVGQVVSYWSVGRPETLRSRDGHRALVLARIQGSDDDMVDRAAELTPAYTKSIDGFDVRVGGIAETFNEVGTTIEHDIVRAEVIAFPVVAILLVIVFGSAIAASLPLLIGVLSILGTFLALHLTVQYTDVSIYSVNLATSLGLGLGIDYSLFMVTRFREELRKGREVPDAVAATVRTAGRTVLFSAITVGLSLGALVVFPLYFLKSFAYAGIYAVLFALIGALVVLPAALAALGTRVDKLDLRRPIRRALRMQPPREKSLDEGLWHRIAVTVMKRPISVATAVIALLVLAGTPFLGVAFSLPDDRVLPKSAEAYQVGQVLRDEFPGREFAALSVIAPKTTGDVHEVAAYATALSRIDGVGRVDAATGTYAGGRRLAGPTPLSARFTQGGGTYLSVVPNIESMSARGEKLVHDVRKVPSPLGDVLVTGQAARLVDTKSSLGSKLPLALGLIVAATFVLLFLFTGSVVIPLKALVLNMLSLSATFGAMVWVFQEGHLTKYIGDPNVTGALDTTTPILMFCVLFGLSMDYEVFLLSRIKEEYDASGDNTRAVALGLERTGRLVSAAAALLALVFLAFVSSDISFIKLLGLGTALAVLVDATLIRGALVPAFMRLMGRANWWAPRPLRSLHKRIGLAEYVELDLPAQRGVDRQTADV
ncbi:MAG: putative drug exporter of the superfamily [Actinomycetota bacterium]|nr:putative drug exporter of the superfamily [Actinomycetota bacterium]